MEKELTNLFNERKIKEQLILDSDLINETRIVWRRKRVDAFVQDGKLETVRTLVSYIIYGQFVNCSKYFKVQRIFKSISWHEGGMANILIRKNLF